MQEDNMLTPPKQSNFVQFPKNFGQRFLVTVDTEEEFDWSAPFEQNGYTLETIPRLRFFQEICENFSIIPCYMIDWPVANSPFLLETLGETVRGDKADIGIQLHPWVNPPFDEAVTPHNSYAGNLPIHLEREKFSRLFHKLSETFRKTPQIYRAGRYGLGPNTANILREFGVPIDSSVRPLFDYSKAGGPNYQSHPLTPYWVGEQQPLLELPLTSVFNGLLKSQGLALSPHLSRFPKLKGLFARTGLLERIPLTPEGTSIAEGTRCVDLAIEAGLPILVFSFHSPSLGIGHTPYVQAQKDLDELFDWWTTLFHHLEKRKIKPISVEEILTSLNL